MKLVVPATGTLLFATMVGGKDQIFLRFSRELAPTNCDFCYGASTGPCQASTTVCYPLTSDKTCPPGTSLCFPATTNPAAVCTNTAQKGQMDKGCNKDSPICVNSGMKEIGSGVNGTNCVKCLNVYNDPPGSVRLRADSGCPDTAPHCVNADGSNPKPYWYAGVKCTDACPLNKLDYTSGFDCPSNYSRFKLNGYAQCKDTATGYLELAAANFNGVNTAFAPFRFSSCNSQLKFTWEVNYRIYGDKIGSDDVFALVIHQDPLGTSALFQYTTAFMIVLVASKDTDGDRIRVFRVDSMGFPAFMPDTPFSPIKNNNGKIKVDHNGTHMNIYMNDNGVPAVVVPIDLTRFFTGRAVYFGFSASTGLSFREVHKFKLIG